MRRCVSHIAARPWDFGLVLILFAVGVADVLGNVVPPEIRQVGLPGWIISLYGLTLTAGSVLVGFAIVQPCSVERAVLAERAGHLLLASALGTMAVLLVSYTGQFHIVDYVAFMCATAGAGSALRAFWLSRRIRAAVNGSRGVPWTPKQ